MAITAAEVESNGYVLRLTLTGALTSPNTNFGAYALDPNGSPRVVLSSSHSGFVKSAGEAVAGTLARALVATLPLRKPVNPVSPTVKVLDETDVGGGEIRVRLALSEHVYATDTSLSLAVLAGWRDGEAAASGISVTNSSALVAPIPIFRWALAPYETTAGSFRVSLLVFSHHPQGLEPVAGVKFTATDGTTVKTIWATELGTDNSYGDNLRCYTAIIDPATATALTAGLLRIDAEVSPWLGSMRTTDAAGTKSMASLRTAAYSVDAASPWAIGYDPAGTRYGQMWAYVDPVNGTTTANASMIATSLAGAKAVAAASRPKDINTAAQAGYLVNRTLAAANSQASQSRSIDGLTIVLAPGTHVGLGATAVTTGLATAEIPARVIGDPEDSDPRTNCIVQTSSNGTQRVTRYRWQNLTIEQGSNSLAGSVTVYNHVDNVTMRGKSGQEGNTVAPFVAGPPAGQWNLAATRSRMWKAGAVFGAGSARVGLFRGNEHSRPLNTHLIAVKNRFIGNVEDGFIGTGVTPAIFAGWTSPTLAGQAEDIIAAFNDIRYVRGYVWQPSILPAATAGTPNPSQRRQVFFGNVCERIGGGANAFYSMGENESVTQSYLIIEGNTFAGDRANTLYSDPVPTTIGETNTLLNQAFCNRLANNVFDWLPSKHDDFYDTVTATLRGTSDGYRPQMVEGWPALFGVGFAGNYDTARATGSNFELMWPGLKSVQNLVGASVDPLYTADGSIKGPGGAGATGGGNYLPLAGSPLLGRVASSNSDRDIVNTPRIINGAAGAFELPPSGPEVSVSGASGGAIAFAAARAAAASFAAVAGAGMLFTAVPNLTMVAGVGGGAAVLAPVSRGVAITVSADAGGGASVTLESTRPTVLVTGIALAGGAVADVPATRGLVQSPIVISGGSIGASIMAVASGLMAADLPPNRIIKGAPVATITFGRGGRPS